MKLSSLLRRGAAPARTVSAEDRAPEFPAPTPDEAICLVGDLHGSLDCLEQFLILRHRHFPHARLVVLGDMIDRGVDSAGVVSALMGEAAEGAICLMGNHEEMLLAALESPAEALSRWLRHGGAECVASFGLDPVRLAGLESQSAADLLADRLGEAKIRWLRSLPLNFRSGNVFAVHAGLDPLEPLSCQAAKTMLWGHPNFTRHRRRDGIWVVHGHTIVDRATRSTGRIALDTGAYATGKLSYALIDPALPEHERVMIGMVHSKAGRIGA